MGMDVYGTAPTSKVGEYFRRNAWGWRPLADLVCHLAPSIARGCTNWQTNDGDGLNDVNSARLADALQCALDDGRARSWIEARDVAVKNAPLRPCQFCAGTGIRTDDIGQRMSQPERRCSASTNVLGVEQPHERAGAKGWCNGCDGRGWNPPNAAYYHVDLDDLSEFVAFLRACGGFKIL